MRIKSSRPVWWLAVASSAALQLTGCTPTAQNTVDATYTDGLMQCTWGEQQFDLCRFDSTASRVNALVAEMTLKEKIGQMTQSIWHNQVSPEIVKAKTIGSIIHTEGPTPGPQATDWQDTFDRFQSAALTTRLGIPLMTAVDAIHGQNTFNGAVIFPHNIGMAATRNFDLIKQAAEITAIEMAGTGFNWTFSPCIAMPYHEHWGRVYEGFSEDRALSTQAVSASVTGHQGSDLSLPYTVAATAKHYLGDGATQGGREGGDSVLDEEFIRAELLPPYIQAIEQNIAAIMVGFNSVNGINMHQHKYLVQDVLKDELGFQGVVITDWNGGIRYGEPHTVINAGVDIAMQPGSHEEFMSKLEASVLDGTVSMARIDDAVTRILTMKFNLGLFNAPFAKREYAQQIGNDQHRNVARQAVRESLVLLKSTNDVLPLTEQDSLAVIGAHANSTGLQSGGWSIHWQGQDKDYIGATNILNAVRNVLPDTQYYAQGCPADMAEDKALIVVGEQPYAEYFGDSTNLNLAPEHTAMIQQCKALGKDVVVVLLSGRVMLINEELSLSDAFIAGWLPGSEGDGVADFLFGKDGFTPTGTLPYSWPRRYEDLPLDKYDDKALFPFGYGLTTY